MFRNLILSEVGIILVAIGLFFGAKTLGIVDIEATAFVGVVTLAILALSLAARLYALAIPLVNIGVVSCSIIIVSDSHIADSITSALIISVGAILSAAYFTTINSKIKYWWALGTLLLETSAIVAALFLNPAYGIPIALLCGIVLLALALAEKHGDIVVMTVS